MVPAYRTIADYDAVYDGVGRAFLSRCGSDAFCAARLGGATTRAHATWDSLDTGHCAEARLDKRTDGG